MKVLGMGNALVDVLAKINNDDMLPALGLLRGAMTLIDKDHFTKLSKVLNGMDKHVVSGGSASNTIVGLAALGIESGFIGRIGKDLYGRQYKEDLQKYGVQLHLAEVEDHSGVASTFISKDGERTFGTYLGAAAMLSPDDISAEVFHGYDLFYIEGYLVQNYALIEKAVKLAKESGLVVAIDLASFNVVEANSDFLKTIIPQYVDVVFANEEEALVLTGLPPEDAVSEIHKMADLAIVKTGANGSWIQQGSTKMNVPVNKVTCVDATGAGDLYAAGFIYGLAMGKEPETCAKVGSLVAREVIQTIGPKVPQDRWIYIKEEVAALM